VLQESDCVNLGHVPDAQVRCSAKGTSSSAVADKPERRTASGQTAKF